MSYQHRPCGFQLVHISGLVGIAVNVSCPGRSWAAAQAAARAPSMRHGAATGRESMKECTRRWRHLQFKGFLFLFLDFLALCLFAYRMFSIARRRIGHALSGRNCCKTSQSGTLAPMMGPTTVSSLSRCPHFAPRVQRECRPPCGCWLEWLSPFGR